MITTTFPCAGFGWKRSHRPGASLTEREIERHKGIWSELQTFARRTAPHNPKRQPFLAHEAHDLLGRLPLDSNHATLHLNLLNLLHAPFLGVLQKHTDNLPTPPVQAFTSLHQFKRAGGTPTKAQIDALWDVAKVTRSTQTFLKNIMEHEAFWALTPEPWEKLERIAQNEIANPLLQCLWTGDLENLFTESAPVFQNRSEDEKARSLGRVCQGITLSERHWNLKDNVPVVTSRSAKMLLIHVLSNRDPKVVQSDMDLNKPHTDDTPHQKSALLIETSHGHLAMKRLLSTMDDTVLHTVIGWLCAPTEQRLERARKQDPIGQALKEITSLD